MCTTGGGPQPGPQDAGAACANEALFSVSPISRSAEAAGLDILRTRAKARKAKKKH